MVGRDIWDVEVGCSSHLTRTKTPLKSAFSEEFCYSLFIAVQTGVVLFIYYALDSIICILFDDMIAKAITLCYADY